MNPVAANWDFGFGEVVYREGGRLGPRVQKNLQLVLVHGGEIEVTVNGDMRVIPPNHATLLLPGGHEFFIFKLGENTHHTWCEALSPQLPVDLRRMLEGIPPVFSITDRMETLLWMGVGSRKHSLTGELSGMSLNPLRRALAIALFEEMICRFGLRERESADLPVSVERTRRFIEDRYPDRLSLNQLAEVSGVSPQHLTREFRRSLGSTPTRYLWRTRVRNGVRLLRETGLSVSEVAYRCGFQTPYHFSRLVRKEYGAPPRKLRRRAWQRESGNRIEK